MSITLPRNFQFHYTDGIPKTPEPESQPETREPPPPPRQTLRIRRRRGVLPTYTLPDSGSDFSKDVPIPTIETSDASCEGPSGLGIMQPPAQPVEGLLTPNPSYVRAVTPPRTPVSQLSAGFPSELEGLREWQSPRPNVEVDFISRPSSSCSGVSDSSISSRESMESFPSFGGSCTSPESDIADPFIKAPISRASAPACESPLQRYRSGAPKRIKISNETQWTEEMDNHLWMTYMKYLQDPTVTPFKMLPGTAPPLGICHRVVREARRTWKGPRVYSAQVPAAVPQRRLQLSRSGSPDTIKGGKSGSTTPTASEMRKPYAKWPSSNSGTRRRLRELCKRKPSLSAHYQRLLRCRSPSPLVSSPHAASRSRSQRLTSPLGMSDGLSSFSTRDMNLSLATSTSVTMQVGNPLSQLASEPSSRADDWFSQPVARINAHQKSQSLHIGLGISSSLRSGRGVNALGSPFRESSRRTAVDAGFDQGYGAPSFHASRLDPPLELHSPMPLSRSFKRRALTRLKGSRGGDEGRQNLLQELFGAPAESSHRRVRSRGFSLGDMGDGGRRLSSLFTPPDAMDQTEAEVDVHEPQPEPQPQPQEVPILDIPDDIHCMEAPEPDRRLGSPFGGRSTNVHFSNTFPRNFTPYAFESAASFEERLGFADDSAIHKTSN